MNNLGFVLVSFRSIMILMKIKCFADLRRIVFDYWRIRDRASSLTMSIHKIGSFEIVISTLIGSSGGDEHCQPGVPKIIPIKMRVNNGAHGLRKHQKMHLHFDG